MHAHRCAHVLEKFWVQYNMAIILKSQDKLPEALAMNIEALAIIKRAYGRNHPRTQQMQASLGQLQSALPSLSASRLLQMAVVERGDAGRGMGRHVVGRVV